MNATRTDSLRNALRREVRVCFSRRGQPVWFRITKWIVLLTITWFLRRQPGLWFWLLGVAAAGLSLHLIYRIKTRAWTRPWGGWDDLEAGREPTRG